MTNDNILKDILEDFKEAQYRTQPTSKIKLNLIRILRKPTEAFSIGYKPLEKIKGHEIKLILDVERAYPLTIRRPPYPASLETRKEIKKHINELL
ncbi:hypothetical protein O181_032085 [Austropuccinia psidii MF-1]|uniref:Uncharacterized protein n=1 Tax=Austropuccinia psidii MF-1 TaxID=1389203 RepID=A0A9Q3H7W1_9BASI|nr:hypothetical protein [Austropuccinia psidii MF-1]